MKKRFMSIALALVLVLGMLPTAVMAAEGGEADSAYAITTSRKTEGNLTVNQKYADEVSATLTYSGSEDGVTDALLKFELTEQPEDSNPQILGTDTEGKEWNLAEVKQWGPATGFPITTNYNETTTFSVQFDKAGTYTAKFTLVSVSDQEQNPLAEGTMTIKVVEALGAGEVSGAILNQSVEAVKDIAVTATAGEAKDGVIPVTITLPEGTKLPKHVNANNVEGYWVGFALTAPEGAEKVKYAFGTTAESVANLTETALEENVTADGGKGIAFYANMDEENPKVYASVQWISAEGNKESTVYTYQMDLSKVVLGKAEEPEANQVGVAVSDFTGLLGKNASDLMENVTVEAGQNNTYILSGTVKMVTSWEAFNSTVVEEQSGHYVALKLTKPETVPDSFTVTLTGSGVPKELTSFFTEGDGAYETVIMRLDALRTGEKPTNLFTVAFNWAEDNVDTYTFDISNLVFEVPEVAVKPDVEGEKASATVEKDAIQDAVDSIIANKDVETDDPDVKAPVIDLSAKTDDGSATAAAITLTNDTVSALAEAAAANEAVTVAIVTDVGAVTINKGVIDKLNTEAGTSESVVLNVEKAAGEPEEAVEGSEVYDVTFTKGDDEVEIAANSGAEITLELVFTVDSTDGLTIGWTSGDETGKVAGVQFSTVVDGKTAATFTVDHLTSFYLVKADEPVEPAKGITLKYTHYKDAGFTEEDGKKYYGGKLEITNNTGDEKTYLVAYDNGGTLNNGKTLRMTQVVTIANGATATLSCQKTVAVTIWEVTSDFNINAEGKMPDPIVGGNGKGIAVETLKSGTNFSTTK